MLIVKENRGYRSRRLPGNICCQGMGRDNSVLPKGLTGLVLKRKGSSYEIILSNIEIKKKSAKEIEKLDYSFKDGTFLIKFGGMMTVKPEKGGLDGILYYNGKPGELFLEKIK